MPEPAESIDTGARAESFESFETEAKTNDRFEIFEDAASEFRFRWKAGNGEIIATGEGYTRRADVRRILRRLNSLLKVPIPISEK